MKKLALKFSIVYFALVACFCALLTASYCIPTELLYSNAKESAELLEKEGTYPKSYVSGIKFDNFTCAIMINEAVHGDSGTPFVDAMRNPFVASGSDGVERLSEWAKNPNQPAEGQYSRYWNGYLVFLKPLLIFFNIQEIRLILSVLFLCAFSLCLITFIQCLGKKVGITTSVALGFAAAYFGFFENASVLPFFSSFFLSMVGMIWISRTLISAERVALGFFVLGALTVYFDFLDNPILTLGFPICVLIIKLGSERDFTARRIFLFAVSALVSWGVSYAAVWAAKWVIASLATGDNVILGATNQMLFRMGGNEGMFESNTSIGGALSSNLEVCGVGIVLLFLCFLCIVMFAMLFVRNKELAIRLLKSHLLLMAVALIPLIWTLALSNHSQIHFWFTWRNFSVAVFALLAFSGIALLGCRTVNASPIES